MKVLLLLHLRSKNPDVRAQAAKSLASYGSRVTQPLLKALSDKDKGVRAASAWALGESRDRTAVVKLIEALKDDDCVLQDEAAQALGKIGDRAAIAPLVVALKTSASRVRTAARKALDHIDPAWPRSAEAAIAVPELVGALKERWEQNGAATALGEIGDRRAVEPLIEALKCENPYAAAEALGRIRDRKAVEPLLAVLKSNHHLAQWHAATALGKIGDPRAVPALVEALRLRLGSDTKPPSKHDDMFLFREFVADALVEIGSDEAFNALGTSLADERLSVRIATALALGKIGDERVVDVLLDAVPAVDNYDLCKAIGWTIRRSRQNMEHAFQRLTEMLQTEDVLLRRRLPSIAGAIGGPKAVKFLLAAIRDKDKGLRHNATFALASVGDRDALEGLIAALGDKEADNDRYQNLHDYAISGLNRIGDERAVRPLADLAVRTRYRAEEAVVVLEKLLKSFAANVPSEDLVTVSRLQNLTNIKVEAASDWDGGLIEAGSHVVDCSRLRRLAQAELDCRTRK